MEHKIWLVYLLIAMVLLTTAVIALEQKWVTWTYSWIENGHTNLYKYQRLAPQECTVNNLACLKLQADGLWN